MLPLPRQCGVNQHETGSEGILHANLYAGNLELKPGAFWDRRGVFGASTWAETSREGSWDSGDVFLRALLCMRGTLGGKEESVFRLA